MVATHSVALPSALERTGRPPRHIRRVIENSKVAGFVTHGRPGSGAQVPITSSDVARLILGLACARQADCVRYARNVGALPLFQGDGPANGEAALIGIIESAAWMRPPLISLDGGEIEIGQSHPELRISGWSPGGDPLAWHYRGEAHPPGGRAHFTLTIPTVAAIARDILIGQS